MIGLYKGEVMPKIIRLKPRIIACCYDCPYSRAVWQGIFNTIGNLFCTRLYASIEETKKVKGKKYPILKRQIDEKDTYVYIENINSIPSFCPLEDYNNEDI